MLVNILISGMVQAPKYLVDTKSFSLSCEDIQDRDDRLQAAVMGKIKSWLNRDFNHIDDLIQTLHDLIQVLYHLMLIW